MIYRIFKKTLCCFVQITQIDFKYGFKWSIQVNYGFAAILTLLLVICLQKHLHLPLQICRTYAHCRPKKNLWHKVNKVPSKLTLFCNLMGNWTAACISVKPRGFQNCPSVLTKYIVNQMFQRRNLLTNNIMAKYLISIILN